jgi:hypothetical protein
MKWPGMQSDVSPIGEGIELCINVSYAIEGELQRRPRLGTRLSLNAYLYGAVQHPEAGRFFVVVGDEEINGYDLDDATEFQIYDLGYAYTGACFANANSRLYYADGISPMLVISRGDATASNAGIAPPVAAPTAGSPSSGVVESGVHLVRYRYKDALTGYLSDPTPPLTFTAAGNEDLPLTLVASADGKVTNIVIEMTLASGSEFFVALETTNTTSATVNISDDNLSVQLSVLSYAPPDGFGHAQPPVAALLVEHRSRLFAWGAKTITGATGDVTNGDEEVDLGADADQGHAYVGRNIRFAAQNKVYSIVSGVGSAIVLNEPYADSTADPIAFTITDPGEDTLWWSRAGYPEGWNLNSWARPILQGMNADIPSGMISYFNNLYCCGQRSMRIFNYDDDPARATLLTVSQNLGCYNQRCLVHVDGRAYGWGMSGAWLLKGTNPLHISRPMDDYLRAHKDDTYASQYFGFYDPVERVVWWAFVEIGETTPRRCFFLDVDSGRWGVRRFRNVLRAGFTYGDASLEESVYIGTGDGDGYTWKLTPTGFDGLPAGMTSGSLTTATGSTTTVLNIQESLGDLAGCIAYIPSQDVERVIASSTANTITLAVAITAPAAGVAVYVGSIPVEVFPFWDLYGERLANKTRPSALEFEARLVDTGVTALAQIYLDFSSSPFNYDELFTDDVQNRGVSTYNATTKALDLQVLLVAVPCPSEWNRCIRYRFLQEEPEGSLALLAGAFFGEPPDVKQDVKS